MPTTVNLINASVVAERILEKLARYRYLNVYQLQQAQAGKDLRTIRERLKELETAKLIGRKTFSLGAGVGRLPDVHWLTSKGVQMHREATGEIAKGGRPDNMKSAHVPHRSLTIDAMIAADAWAKSSGQSEPVFRSYMEYIGRAPGTALDFEGGQRLADAIMKLEDTQGRTRTYVLEVYCNGRDHALKQLPAYVLSSVGRINRLDTALNIPDDGGIAGRVLIVCDTETLRDDLLRLLPTRRGMPDLDRRLWGRFLFKASSELADFGSSWHQVSSELVDLPA